MPKIKWNAYKKELWKLPANELMLKLQELEKERFSLENELHFNGKQNKRFGYGSFMGSKALPFAKFSGGNLKQLRHMIAFVKTILNQKEVKNGTTKQR